MYEDLLNHIDQVVKEDNRKQKEDRGPASGIVVGNIVGNGNTVVIGGNNNQGRREEDKPNSDDGTHGRRASDRKVYKELRQLRRQVSTLTALVDRLQKKQAECLVTCKKSVGETGFKREVKASFSARHSWRKLCDETSGNCPIYLTRSFSDSASTNRAECRVIADPIPFLPKLFIGSPTFPILSVTSHIASSFAPIL